MPKLPRITSIACLALLLALSCSNEKKPGAARSSQTHPDTAYRQTLGGAEFPDTVCARASLYFSDPESPDEFSAIVPPGPLAETKAVISIRTRSGQLLYADSFDTRYFTKYIWNPDTVPAELSGEQYEKYLLQYSAGLSKKEIEARTASAIRNYFRDVAFNREEIRAIASFGSKSASEFCRLVAKDSSRRVVVLPCFDCESEGRCYLTWSPGQGKVVSLLVADE
jgi:hypothetical protein